MTAFEEAPTSTTRSSHGACRTRPGAHRRGSNRSTHRKTPNRRRRSVRVVDVLAAGVRSDLLSVLPRNRSDQNKGANAGHDPTVNPARKDTTCDSTDRRAMRCGLLGGFSSEGFEYGQGSL